MGRYQGRGHLALSATPWRLEALQRVTGCTGILGCPFRPLGGVWIGGGEGRARAWFRSVEVAEMRVLGT